MTYYQRHKQERLEYQKQYNKSENYRAYQNEYHEKNKEQLMKKTKERKKKQKEQSYKEQPDNNKPYISLKQYQLYKLEVMLRRKLKDYYNTMESINKAKRLISLNIKDTSNVVPLSGTTIKNNMFVVSFD
jgi:hypothetical protein